MRSLPVFAGAIAASIAAIVFVAAASTDSAVAWVTAKSYAFQDWLSGIGSQFTAPELMSILMLVIAVLLLLTRQSLKNDRKHHEAMDRLDRGFLEE